MNVFLATLGCRLNEAEIATWDRDLDARGHRAVASPDAAQVIVVNSCAVTAEAARKSRKLVASLRRQNEAAPIVLTGCYATLEPERAAALAGVDLVIDNRDKDELAQALEGLPIAPASQVKLPLAPRRDGRTRAFVKVQDGCRNRCTFCIVTVARGEERSRTVRDVVDHVATLAASGVREAVLTGVHLGGYGSDIGSDLTELTRAVLADTEIDRLRLSSLEPWDLPENFHELWADPRLAPHLHLPLQSGCDATLKRMARRCPTARYRDLVALLRKNVSDLTVTTDLIVGFPGETDDEWAQTVDFAGEMDFAHMHIFSYSAREGTAAARFPNTVPNDVKRARSTQMHALAQSMKTTVLERHVGTRRPVLWEAESKAQGSLARFSGYTDNYLRVVTDVPETRNLGNEITDAPLVAATADYLVAESRTLPLA